MGTVDAVIAHNDYALPFHLRRALGKNVRILLYVHNEPASDFRFLRRSLASVDKFIAISGFVKQRIVTRLGIDPERVEVALNGVNTSRFYPSPRVTPTGLERRILFVGRVNEDKGPDIGAKAVLKLRTEGFEVSLDIAGPVWWHGEDVRQHGYYGEVSRLVEQGGGRMLGHVPRHDVPELMRQYDITCALSRWPEPYGLVVSEAMASGCVVWASNRGGIPEVLGDAGVQANPENLQEVCDVLRPLLVDDELLIKRKRASLARAGELTWAAAAAVVERCCNHESSFAAEPVPA